MKLQSELCNERTLFVCDKRSGAIEVCQFSSLSDWLNAGDAIVVAVEKDKQVVNTVDDNPSQSWLTKTHFSPISLKRLTSRGVKIAPIHFHVKPLQGFTSKNHHAQLLQFVVPDETADALNESSALGHHILAEGLPVLKILQAASDELGFYHGGCGLVKTYEFSSRPRHYSAVDMLLTEIHPPASTDFLLGGSSFAGPVLVGRVHREAVAREIYRQESSVAVLFI